MPTLVAGAQVLAGLRQGHHDLRAGGGGERGAYVRLRHALVAHHAVADHDVPGPHRFVHAARAAQAQVGGGGGVLQELVQDELRFR